LLVPHINFMSFWLISVCILYHKNTNMILSKHCKNYKKSLIFMHTAKSLKKSYHISIQRKFQKKKN
jgi:hypothetical protein